jgi:hypothetical protein
MVWRHNDLLNVQSAQCKLRSLGGCLQESSHGGMVAVVSSQWGIGSEQNGVGCDEKASATARAMVKSGAPGVNHAALR